MLTRKTFDRFEAQRFENLQTSFGTEYFFSLFTLLDVIQKGLKINFTGQVFHFKNGYLKF